MAADPCQNSFRHEFDRTGRKSADLEVAIASENRLKMDTIHDTKLYIFTFQGVPIDCTLRRWLLAYSTACITSDLITGSPMRCEPVENSPYPKCTVSQALIRGDFVELLAFLRDLSQNSGAHCVHYV